MGCPFAQQAQEAELRSALAKCPFLRRISVEQSESFAAQVATQPFKPAREHGPILEEGPWDFHATFRLFHGPTGIVPLAQSTEKAAAWTPRALDEAGSRGVEDSSRTEQERSELRRYGSLSASAAPFASISIPFLRFLPNPGEFFLGRRRRERRRLNGAGERGQQASAASSKGTSSGGGGSGGHMRPRTLRPGRGRIGHARGAGLGAGAGAESARCPLRDWPLVAGLVPLSARGELACPQAIIAARAAVARLRPVRDLRPRALPVKLLALSALGLAVNVPFGAAREHTRKFSLAWFVAVHASIPFITMLRKGVAMPPWAIVLTIASAVAGQGIGAALERERLQRGWQLAPLLEPLRLQQVTPLVSVRAAGGGEARWSVIGRETKADAESCRATPAQLASINCALVSVMS